MSGGGYGYSWTAADERAQKEKDRKRKKREQEEIDEWDKQGYKSVYSPKYDEKGWDYYKMHREAMAHNFTITRTIVEEMEETIHGLGPEWSEKDKKRFDKAIVLIKVGCKYLERVLERHGMKKKKLWQHRVTFEEIHQNIDRKLNA